ASIAAASRRDRVRVWRERVRRPDHGDYRPRETGAAADAATITPFSMEAMRHEEHPEDRSRDGWLPDHDRFCLLRARAGGDDPVRGRHRDDDRARRIAAHRALPERRSAR